MATSTTPTTPQTATPSNPKAESNQLAATASEAQRAAQAQVEAAKQAEDTARVEREARETAAQKATADALAAKAKAEGTQDSEDPQYLKALNEEDGLTLVPEASVKDNFTVERVGTKVFPNGMVIAKRK